SGSLSSQIKHSPGNPGRFTLKKYRVLLNRVDTSTAQDIEWPALP
ncbi:tail fiber assembly protein, partial [Escherichia coli]